MKFVEAFVRSKLWYWLHNLTYKFINITEVTVPQIFTLKSWNQSADTVENSRWETVNRKVLKALTRKSIERVGAAKCKLFTKHFSCHETAERTIFPFSHSRVKICKTRLSDCERIFALRIDWDILIWEINFVKILIFEVVFKIEKLET